MDLKDIRKKINQIDEEMAKLFEERMKVSSEVASYKKEHALPIFDSSREQEVINKNIATVQEIACLLGEHMVETELLLSSIAKDFDVDEKSGES